MHPLVFLGVTHWKTAVPSAFFFFNRILLYFVLFLASLCDILVPRPGIEPLPPALGVQSLNYWTTREVPVPSAFIATFIYFWLCWVFGSCEGPPRLRQAGAPLHRGAGTALHRGARAPHYRGPPRRGAQAPDAQAQQPWLTGPAAPRHVGSSQTRARTRAPCISRQTLNHCATREALPSAFK